MVRHTITLSPSGGPGSDVQPDPPCRPFLKWAGGKQRLIAQYARFFPPCHAFVRYIEPFLGGGSVFFHLRPSPAILGDLNEELIDAYVAVRDNLMELEQAMSAWTWNRLDYYRARAWHPDSLSPVQRAARFIYLNRTGWNGLYRVNREGRYNVPMGRSKTNGRWLDVQRIRAASEALQSVELVAASYQYVCEKAQTGDFIYLDPPYHGPDEQFTKYTPFGFTYADHERLADLAVELWDRGCLVMMSNSFRPYVQQLYSERGFDVHQVVAPHGFNSNPARRQSRAEFVAMNFTNGGKDTCASGCSSR